MIYILGDSHVCFFLGVNKRIYKLLDKTESIYPFFSVNYVGHATAYGLLTQDSASHGRTNTLGKLEKIPLGSTLLFVFGEIDCRAWIPRNQNIKEVVSRYLSFVQQIREKGYKVLLWGVTSKKENKIVEEFNNQLKFRAGLLGVGVVDIYGRIAGKDEYFMDEAHLSQKAMPFALEEFKKLNLI